MSDSATTTNPSITNCVAAVDFETFYRKTKKPELRNVNIDAQGVWHYLRDREVNVYLTSVVDHRGNEFCGDPGEFNFGCIGGPNWTWISHNASFDEEVAIRLIELGVITEDQLPGRWLCTSDMVSYFGLPRSLKEAVETVFKIEVSKNYRNTMNGKHWHEITGDARDEVIKAGLDDAKWCLKLWQKFGHVWPEWEKEVSLINRLAGRRGVGVDLQKVEDYMELVTAKKVEIINELPWVKAGYKPLSTKAVEAECKTLGIPKPATMAAGSEAFDLWLSEYEFIAPWARSMSIYRQANTILKKVSVLKDRLRPDGTMQMQAKYFGATTTGRFSGAAGFNFQNLSRKPILGVDMRSCLICEPGEVYIMCDLANIEVRTLHWLAHDWSTLAKLAAGHNPYEVTASNCGMWEGKMNTLKKDKPRIYQAAKSLTLGAGYGMSAKKFVVAAPLLTGGEFTPDAEESSRLISLYREANPLIPGLWRSLEKALKTSAENKERLELQLPSGRTMYYHDIRAVSDEQTGRTKYTAIMTKGSRMMRCFVYGANLVENLSQALAREIFAWQMRETDRAGLVLRLHAHDELVISSHEKDAEENKLRLTEIMSAPPPWCPSIPLACEAEISAFYKK